jgi:uncharacterized protein YkwD
MLRAPTVRAIGRRVITTFLLGMSAASVQPSARVMAYSADGEAADQTSSRAALKPASATSPDIPLVDYDFAAERELLALANQARSQAGAPPLALDAGLSRAARAHAEAMVDAQQLSHQFVGEPSLPQRLAAATRKQLDQEGENVALDYDAPHAQQSLMLSPPHRANLLNASYNLVGLGVVRSGGRLYIVQDFGHALPGYSIDEVKERIAAAVTQARRQAKQRDLAPLDLHNSDLPNLDTAACSMARADKLGVSAVQQLAQRYNVVTYTTLHPEMLPESAAQLMRNRDLRSFSVGACYAQTNTYPTGVYWVVLALD